MWLQVSFYSMILLIGKLLITVHSETPTSNPFHDQNCNFIFYPYNINALKEGTNRKLTINCTCISKNRSNQRQSYLPTKGSIIIIINTYNKHVAQPSLIDYRSVHPEKMASCDMTRWCSTLKFDFYDQNFFFIHANQVGISRLVITILKQNGSINSGLNSISYPPSSSSSSTTSSFFTSFSSTSSSVSALEVPAMKMQGNIKYINIVSHGFEVKVLRNYKTFHSVFDYSATFIASLTAFSVGCCTEIGFLELNFKKPKAVIMSLVCQHIIMPLITMAVSASLQLPSQLAFGLCAMSAIPGGGLAHLIVVLIHGDRPLSTSISILNTILGVVFLSLWLLFFSWLYQLSTEIEYVIIWIFPGVIAHSAGFFINRFQPDIAQGILTWFSRPILLLSAILLITLGVYVNHYAFHYIDYQVMSGLCLVIFGGYCIGGAAGFIFKQTTETMKSIAAENSVFNCLLLIPALRDAMAAPHGDLAAAVPLWGVFFTPAPIILYFVVHKIKVWVIQFVERRRRKQNQHFSIVTSLAKMAEGMSAVSAPITLNSTTTPVGDISQSSSHILNSPDTSNLTTSV